jgi:extracellular factor (EF) 3-hydroxypalmitic acid methyl ester biosynthesis protein
MAGSQSALSEDAAAAGRLKGRLEGGGGSAAVAVAEASRVSLRVWFEGEPAPTGTTFDRLRLQTAAGEKILSSCRLVADAAHGAHGRLVFLDDVYDCKALVGEGTIVDVRALFHNLALVVSQREKVRPEFKAFVADAMYDVSAYKRFFDEQEAVFAKEPPEIAEAARDALVRAEHERFFRFMDDHVRGLEEACRDFTREEHERHGFYFRRQAWPYIFETDVLRQINVKPHGYAGDAEAMVMIYRDEYSGPTAFHRLLHRYSVNTSAAKAVRFRRHYVPDVMRDVRARLDPGGARPFRFLSLACGPAWELEDVFVRPEDFEQLRCGLLDQDRYALGLARQTIARIEQAHRLRIEARYLEDSVRTMLRTRDLAGRFGTYEFIYAMGLFDYLSPPVGRAVLEKTYELLAPGGAIVIGNYHVRNPARLYMEYWGDWPLYYRSEQALMDLAAGIAAEKRISFDPSGSQMFLRIDRGQA